MTGKDKETSEDKLLDLPADDDPESASERSNLRYQRRLDEFNHELAGDTLPRMLFPGSHTGAGRAEAGWL
jgi:hypothetical protein